MTTSFHHSDTAELGIEMVLNSVHLFGVHDFIF